MSVIKGGLPHSSGSFQCLQNVLCNHKKSRTDAASCNCPQLEAQKAKTDKFFEAAHSLSCLTWLNNGTNRSWLCAAGVSERNDFSQLATMDSPLPNTTRFVLIDTDDSHTKCHTLMLLIIYLMLLLCVCRFTIQKARKNSAIHHITGCGHILCDHSPVLSLQKN